MRKSAVPPIALKSDGITKNTIANHAATEHLMRGLNFCHVQFAGIHARSYQNPFGSKRKCGRNRACLALNSDMMHGGRCKPH